MLRRSIATVGAVLLGLSITPGAAGAAPGPDAPGPSAAERSALSAGISLGAKSAPGARPAGANPFLSMLEDPARTDYSGWSAHLRKQATQKAKARDRMRAVAAPPLLVDEDEPAGTRGSNDDPDAAQVVRGFGTG
ncbi:MAG TPA: hypothetical protein VF657_25955, partial [Actinoplanes sp.]